MANVNEQMRESAISDYDRLKTSSARIDLSKFALIEVSGEDRKGWLQGQVTNDLRHFNEGRSSNFCLCEATGHLLAPIQGWALTDRILLTTPRDCVEKVLERFEKMTILEDVVAKDVTNDHWIGSIQGPSATRDLADWVDFPNLDAGMSAREDVEIFALRSNRTVLGGWDLWIPRTAQRLVETLEHRFPLIDPEAAESLRIESGVPEWGKDMGPRTLPPEMGPVFQSQYISYSKGCYVGQEVLMRVYSRGHTNKTWVGLEAESMLEVGHPVTLGGKEVGTVTSVASSPDFGYLGAAVLRNEAADAGTEVKVGNTRAEVRRMPILRFE